MAYNMDIEYYEKYLICLLATALYVCDAEKLIT